MEYGSTYCSQCEDVRSNQSKVCHDSDAAQDVQFSKRLLRDHFSQMVLQREMRLRRFAAAFAINLFQSSAPKRFGRVSGALSSSFTAPHTQDGMQRQWLFCWASWLIVQASVFLFPPLEVFAEGLLYGEWWRPAVFLFHPRAHGGAKSYGELD